MTPIFVRPVREQLEHDRLIRFLHAKIKAKRKFDVLANAGDERQAPIKVGNNTYFPDLVLLEGKKVAALIEIETGESTNNLEAMAQWTHFSRARVPFHLYVPVLAVDTARRLCESNHVLATEIWSYRPVNDQFDLVRVHFNADAVRASSKGSKAASLPVVLPPPKPVLPAPEPTPAKAPVAGAASPEPKAKAGAPVAKAGSPKPLPPKPVPAKAAPVKPAAKAAPVKPAAKAAAAPKPKPKASKPKPKPKASKPKPKAKAKPKGKAKK